VSTFSVFTGNANPKLAGLIADHLGIPLGKAIVSHFSDGETMVEIKENVRGKDVFVIQSTSSPSNDHVMELLLMADALRRASAGSITAVMPYFGYARQDRRVRSARVPITAKIIADQMQAVGITRLLTVELHADQIQGFFYMPVDNIFSSQDFLADLKKQQLKNILFVSPDVGGVVRARAIAKRFEDADLAIIDKRRSVHNEVDAMNVIGDPKDRDCVLIDDIVDTANTLCKAAEELKSRGARKVLAYCTHPVLSGEAIERINNSALDLLVVSDTIPLHDSAKTSQKIRQISLGGIIAKTILRVSKQQSVSTIFLD
jgi:ribose-phosphate pyrophosphokinase